MTAMNSLTSTETPQNDSLKIVRGEPTPEELAALVAVLAAGAAAGSPAEPERPRAVSGWTDRSRYVRTARPEFGARSGWRASALPR